MSKSLSLAHSKGEGKATYPRYLPPATYYLLPVTCYLLLESKGVSRKAVK